MGIFVKNKNRQPKHIASITAGGASYNAADYTGTTEITLLKQNWQSRAFDIYDSEGHLYYATNYVGSALARIQLVGAIKPKNHGELEQPTILETGPVADAIAGIESPTGGQSGFLRQIGRNIFLTGEAWVIGSTETYPDGTVTTNWDAVSVDEMVNDGGKTKRRRLPGQAPENLPAGAFTMRIWKEHPRYSKLADAGTRSCMELLEKIIILNRAEKAVARSQLAGSGILALPQELVPPAWQNQDKNANPMESNPLWQGLAESMIAPLKDESSPSAVVPFLLVGPGEVIKNIKYEPLTRTFDSGAAQSSIKMAIEQIANTLELPKEILLGTGDATHWTAWSIREDVFQAHIQPLIELICAGLTRTFLKKALAKFSDEELKKAGIENRDDIIVWYDASQLVIQPDHGDKMLALHDRFIVTDEAVAEALGVPKDERLDTESEEYKKRVGIKMADPKMATTGVPTEPPAPAGPAGASGGGAGPKGISPARGKSPQGPNSSPAKLPSERRARPGVPQESKTSTLTAAAFKSAAVLGEFDVRQLRKLREMCERHVTRACTTAHSMTSAADPADFIEDEFIRDFIQYASGAWDEGIGVVTGVLGALPSGVSTAVIREGIRDSASYYQQLLNTLIGKNAFPREPIYGEFLQGERVQFGDVRPLLVRLGGGSDDATIPLNGGITSGTTMAEWLRTNGVTQGEKKIWLYGDQGRRVFNGHLQMNGLVFEDWDDPALEISPQDAWLRRSHYRPGDHWGCACVVAPFVPNFGDDLYVSTPTAV